MPQIPKIGLRILKSALAVFLCFLIDWLRGDGIPFYSAIAAILCMQQDVPNSWKVGLNRVIGTFLGGICGLVVLSALMWMELSHPLLQAFTICVALILVMYLTVLLRQTSATYITCVVFLSITVSHGADPIPWLFAFNRVVDTLLGIFLSLAVNLIHPPAPSKKPKN